MMAKTQIIILLVCLFSAAASFAQPFAYITNTNEDVIRVLDTNTNNVVDTINVGASPDSLAVTKDGTKVYFTHRLGDPFDDDAVSVIDTSNNTVIDTIEVGLGPFGLAVTPDGSTVYTTLIDGVHVIDTGTSTVTDIIDIDFPTGGLAVSPDGTRLYIADGGGNNAIQVVDTSNNMVIDSINVGLAPLGLEVTHDGQKLYVANFLDNTVSVIDLSTNMVIETVDVGSVAIHLAVSPDDERVYVTNAGDSTVSVIDTSTDTVIDTVFVGGFPRAVDVTPNNKKVLVVRGSGINEGVVTVLKKSNNNIIGEIDVETSPDAFGVFIGPQPPAMVNNVNNGSGILIQNSQNKISLSGITPNKKAAIILGYKKGNKVLQQGKCAGTQLGIIPFKVIAKLRSNSDGNVNKAFYFPPSSENMAMLQIVDIASCEAGNVFEVIVSDG